MATYSPATPFGTALPSYSNTGLGALPDVTSGNQFLGSFNYGGQGYYADPSGYVYNQNAYNNFDFNPYGQLYNTGQFYQYNPSGQGTNQGSYLGTINPSMMTFSNPNFQIQGANPGYNPGPGVPGAAMSYQNNSAMQNPVVNPAAGAVTPPATTTPAAGSSGASSGAFNYPMDPLGTVLGYPTIAALLGITGQIDPNQMNNLLSHPAIAGQLNTAGQLLSQQGMEDTLRPMMDRALENVGRTNLVSSSNTDRIFTNTIRDAVTANMLGAADIYGNVAGQLPGLTQASIYPTYAQGNLLASLNAQIPGLAEAYMQPFRDQLDASLKAYL